MSFRGGTRMPGSLAAVGRARDLGIFVALAVTVLIFGIQADNFATTGNCRTSPPTSRW
jgi:hypothetical protein